MKTIKLLGAIFFLLATATIQAQTAEEIVANYIENTGGADAWKSIKNMKMSGKAGFGPQEFVFTQVVTADGKMSIEIDLGGQKFVPQAFDGESMWTTNFQSQKPEPADAEASSNFKNESKDQIIELLGYKEKGYTIEKLEDGTAEGVDCFRIKLTKKPILRDGKEEDNIRTYFIDKENFVPVMLEAVVSGGPQAGTKSQTVYSDYEEAGPVYFAYSIVSKFNGQVGQSIKIENIEVNTEIDESIFKMPAQ